MNKGGLSSMLTLKIENESGVVVSASGESEVVLVYENEYKPGECLTIECDKQNQYLILQLDDAMSPAFVFLTENKYSLLVPFEEKRVSYSPRTFSGDRHVLYARSATTHEIAMYKNLAFNPYDGHLNSSLFPHATANVETRGEAVFAARNAIDGNKANIGHGPWPYQSWGINRDPNAEIKIDFGREVIINRAVVYLRADFPHDAWWEQITVEFSDGSSLDASFIKTHEGQAVEFEQKTVQWVILKKLIKADDPSPFPALTQIEFYGTEK